MHTHTLSSIIGNYSPDAPLSELGESMLIEDAQSGDHDALIDLIRQYAPAFRRALGRVPHGYGDKEDIEQALLLAFIELVDSHDTAVNPRLAGRVATSLQGAMSQTVSENISMLTIPGRTVRRFLGILQRADGDYEQARSIATQHGMTVETFDAVARASQDDGSVTEGFKERFEAGTSVTYREPANAEEDADLAHFALGVVTGDSLTVIRAAYGFDPVIVDGATFLPEGYAPLSDLLVATHTGLSRQKVQRLRTGALATMREAIAVEVAL